MTAHLAHTLWASGNWPEAATLADRALADGGTTVVTRATALHVHGYLALGRGDWPAAEESLREARVLGERMAELQRLSPALWGLAEMALRKGQSDAAIDLCERGYTASSPAWDAAYLFPFVVTGVRAYLAVHGPTAARDWLSRCERFLTYRSIPGTMPALDHGRGLLHLADGRTGQARAALTAASAGWDAGRRFWEGTQAIFDRAVVAHRSRRPGEATRLYDEAERRADAVGATVLGTGRATNRAAPDAPQTLTAREIEVARLIAGGGTNRQIAVALSISPKTVSAHVEHILTKLNAARRTEIAAWATANGAVTRRQPSR
jgi:DNA-binding CsgD family transcriptional regulator